MKEELEKIWKVKAKGIPAITGALGTIARKLKKWIPADSRSNISI